MSGEGEGKDRKSKSHDIHFSPTGGTKTVTDILCRAWEEEKQEIDLSVFQGDYTRYVFEERSDICVVGKFRLSWEVPRRPWMRLRQMKGGGAQAVPVAVYGNREYDDTLLELEEALTDAGFHCTAAAAAVAEHSVMRQFGAGRPDEKDRAELGEVSKRIKEKLERHNRGEKVKGTGE